MDSQTSADASAGGRAAGAMTTAFSDALRELKNPYACCCCCCIVGWTDDCDRSIFDVLVKMRRLLKQRRFDQLPQLSTEHKVDVYDAFNPLGNVYVPPPASARPSTAASVPPPVSTRPPRRKALSIGINYYNLPRGQGRLDGCINDTKTIVDILKSKWGFNDIRILTDDNKSAMPTRANILAALDWLVADAQPGDSLFFHYSGHGGQDDDLDGDDKDGQDECIYPCDFQKAGSIVDDELRKRLVLRVPAGVELYALMDCCHSGTGLDLPMKHKLVTVGKDTVVQTEHSIPKQKSVCKQVVDA